MGLNKTSHQNQSWVGGTKIPMPGAGGVSFKDVAATQGVFNTLKLNAAPKVTMPGK
jgi:hypothetical protein